MAKKRDILLTVLFCGFIGAMAALTAFLPKQEVSVNEKRTLAKFPEFSVQKLFNGKWEKDFETYISDHFPARNFFASTDSYYMLYSGRNGSNGVYKGKDGYIINTPVKCDEEKLNANITAINNFVKNTGIETKLIVVPSTGYIMSEELPKVHTEYNDSEIIDDVKNRAENAEFIDIRDTLTENKDKQIYYKTDHHWTTLGAYYAYVAYCEQKGLTPVSLEELKENKVEDFYGTFYSKAKRPSQPADTITWYDVDVDEFAFVANLQQDKQLAQLGEVVQEDGLELLRVDGMMDQRKFEVRDKYAAFMWGNSGYVKIKSNHNLNHQEGKTSRLLLFKDSYANSMIPYLTYNYDEIIVVDLRYMAKSTKELMQEEFDDIFVMYNFSTYVSGASDLAKLKF